MRNDGKSIIRERDIENEGKVRERRGSGREGEETKDVEKT